MVLIPYDSELWTVYRGAYDNVCDEIKIVMGDTSQAKQEDYETAYENLWEELSHQMDFYEAIYIVLPYMVKLLEKNEDNFDRSFSIILNVGLCLATDIPYFTKRIDGSSLSCYDSVYNSYENAVFIFGEKTKDFIKKHFQEIKVKDSDEKWEFAMSVMAILGDRTVAYELFMLFVTDWLEGSISIKCDSCGYYDDCNYLDDDHFLESIIPAPVEQWDGINYGDTYVWFYSFLHDLEVEEADIVTYLYGTYTCPQCGGKKKVIDFMKAVLSCT